MNQNKNLFFKFRVYNYWKVIDKWQIFTTKLINNRKKRMIESIKSLKFQIGSKNYQNIFNLPLDIIQDIYYKSIILELDFWSYTGKNIILGGIVQNDSKNNYIKQSSWCKEFIFIKVKGYINNELIHTENGIVLLRRYYSISNFLDRNIYQLIIQRKGN